MDSYIGERFGNYRLVQSLGSGGFAQVYLGVHEHLGTQAAVKVLSTNVSSDEEFELLRKEARTIAKLVHPNIVRVWDIDKQEIKNQKIPYLVMEYAEKGTLATFLPKGKPIYFLMVATYIKQIAEALQFAHEQNLIHRDVKPANILVFKNDIIKLSDFGIALVARATSSVSSQSAVGTPVYMAPEQIMGNPVFASDQYALGIMAYEWLSGDLPFHGTSQEVCTQHLQARPPSLAGKVPSNVEQVLFTALQKAPQKRFPSVIAFAELFEHACQAALDALEKAWSPE